LVSFPKPEKRLADFVYRYEIRWLERGKNFGINLNQTNRLWESCFVLLQRSDESEGREEDQLIALSSLLAQIGAQEPTRRFVTGFVTLAAVIMDV
jgi:hypothetical protein